MTAQNTDLDISRFTVLNKIGDGSFGDVYRIKDNQCTEYYAAKFAKLMIDEDTKDSEEVKLLFREVNLMSVFNHPSILKFVGYYSTNFDNDPVLTLIIELATNGSLRDLIEREKSGLSPDGWDDTKKLIIIYGIASGMSYLHKHNVLHRDLKPENILIDDYLHPKISDFGLSKLTDCLSVSMNYQSQKGQKGSPAYMAPEILGNEEYSTAGDVYAFAFIVFEVITTEAPYKNISILQLIKKVKQGHRPPISTDVPDSYRELIESCWSQDPSKRPSFDEIISDLKENKNFITAATDELEFYDYVDFIDNYRSTFDISKRVIHFSEFIKCQGRNKAIRIFSIKNNEPIEEESIQNMKINETNKSIQNTSQRIILSNDKITTNINTSQKVHEEVECNESSQKVLEEIECIDNSQNIHEEVKSNENLQENYNNINDNRKRINSKEFIFPILEFHKLTKSCQTLVEDSITDPSKQFIVGKSLIEETNEFPKNVKVGIQYIEESIKHNFIESIIYYCNLLIEGHVIPRDLQKSNEYLSKISTTRDARILLLKGKIYYKQNKFKESVKYLNILL